MIKIIVRSEVMSKRGAIIRDNLCDSFSRDSWL